MSKYHFVLDLLCRYSHLYRLYVIKVFKVWRLIIKNIGFNFKAGFRLVSRLVGFVPWLIEVIKHLTWIKWGFIHDLDPVAFIIIIWWIMAGIKIILLCIKTCYLLSALFDVFKSRFCIYWEILRQLVGLKVGTRRSLRSTTVRHYR